MGKFTDLCIAEKERAKHENNIQLYTECCYRIYCFDLTTSVVELAPLTTDLKIAHAYYKNIERVLNALYSDWYGVSEDSHYEFQQKCLEVGNKFFSFTILNNEKDFQKRTQKALNYILPIWWEFRQQSIKIQEETK